MGSGLKRQKTQVPVLVIDHAGCLRQTRYLCPFSFHENSGHGHCQGVCFRAKGFTQTIGRLTESGSKKGAVRMTGVSRRALLGWVAGLALGVMVCGTCGAPTPTAKGGIVGTWQGTLTLRAGTDLADGAERQRDEKGALRAMFYSIDQGGRGIPSRSASFDIRHAEVWNRALRPKYEGKMSADGNSISGTSTQGDIHCRWYSSGRRRRRSGPCPRAPPRIPRMAADANPSFEVATIKPTKPDEKRHAFVVQGTSFKMINSTLNEFDQHFLWIAGQANCECAGLGASEHFDIDAKPDTPGRRIRSN